MQARGGAGARRGGDPFPVPRRGIPAQATKPARAAIHPARSPLAVPNTHTPTHPTRKFT